MAVTPTKQVVIENPVINSPFEEPRRHYRFSEDGITDEIVESRRVSSYFIPVAQPKKKGKQLVLDTEWTKDRIEENKFINYVRARVALWRQGGYPGITKTSSRLLEYWTNPDRERKLFFCQIEALETAIYVTEAARKYGDASIENTLREANDGANPGLFRLALKMATGSGKTVVMAMLIAWHALNKFANSQDAHFSDTFLIATPGITIRDRLRVLLPNDPDNYYVKMDVVPPESRDDLNKAKLVITNFHAFKCRETIKAGKLTKAILGNGEKNAFTETPDQMVRRVCRELGNKKGIIVINDEAHHCYRRKPDGEEVKLTGDERKEAEKRDEYARIWISGLEAVKQKIGVKAIYDLSATPFFLRGSGYSEGTLFPWVVSDFSLIDAIESGIVKVPRVPVADDSMQGEQPTYRDLWLRIREHLPKKRRSAEGLSGEPKLPAELEGALQSLYSNYEKYYRKWEDNTAARENGQTPPVFIVVCNNTSVSKMVFDYIAGWEKGLSDGSSVVVPGKLSIFSNEEEGTWRARPNSVLIDSEQLESGESMSDDFKKIAAREIEEFKADYRTRFPGRDTDKLTDEDLLREVMNTVGKPGRLGEHVKCVVSVSMLTEGWDANTVTHILGIRAFGTQLLCEQVVGRGLRRMSYALNGDNRFEPEYAEVYGVPFSFIPCSGSTTDPPPGPIPTRVRALEDRIDCEITFPRVIGYRYELPTERLSADFSEDSHLALSAELVPTWTENKPIVGESSIHRLDDLKTRRMQEVSFLLAKLVLEKYFRQDGTKQSEHRPEHKFDSEVQAWLFPQVLAITRDWLDECVTCKDNAFPQMLLLLELAHDAADRIYRSIVSAAGGDKRLLPILRPYDTVGSTRYVSFDTTRPVYATDPAKCHISHVVADTDTWEQKMAQTLEEMDEVAHYVKNHNLGFYIPYTINGEEKNYIPDFIVRINDRGNPLSLEGEGQGEGESDVLNLILEVSGEQRKDKAAKVSTARSLWVPAINNSGEFGRWAFIEIGDPWDAKNRIRAFLECGDSSPL
ncbi:MAG: DEAD/DEAH box helicase family protein [Armatimonadota bacterium]|nr:DEAD/DEAH box helicase family protein [Armatimonadota bacterium]